VNVEVLVEEINKHFKAPFLHDGFVSAKINHQGDFVLKIGARDMQLRSNGKFVGAGTDWTIGYHIVEFQPKPIIMEEN